MELRDWQNIVKDPTRLGTETGKRLEELGRLREEHPHCQLLHLLYCQGLKQEGDLEWKRSLHEVAIRVPDRVELYRALCSVPIEKEDDPEGDGTLVNEGGSELEELGTKEPSEEATEGKEGPVDKGPDPTPMKQEILSEVVRQGVLYDPEKMLGEEEEGAEGAVEKKGLEGEQQGERTEERAGKKLHSGKKRFTEWLGSGDDTTAEVSPSREGGSLIDRFLHEGRERIQVRPEREAFFSSERMARKSSDEEGLPVSETLAELYVQQGELKHAIRSFEKLRLKVPEKSDYFARRIEELKQHLKG